ncbi:MAG: copper-binding protein [Deltaproteobacteria bacterium]|jgi:Cu/Ag efflux protein CusF|nr:copper-binding protein [Deltaproteobacteria bacterium]
MFKIISALFGVLLFTALPLEAREKNPDPGANIKAITQADSLDAEQDQAIAEPDELENGSDDYNASLEKYRNVVDEAARLDADLDAILSSMEESRNALDGDGAATKNNSEIATEPTSLLDRELDVMIADAEQMINAVNEDGAAGEIKNAGEAIFEGEGVVRSIDRGKLSVVLRHAPIPALGWGPMTMGFPVENPALLEEVKEGDRVRFDLSFDGPPDQPTSRYSIVEMEVLE